MSIEFEAIYENGVLRPSQPLPLRERECVVVSIKPRASRLRQLAGSIPWKGDPEELRQIAEELQFGISESP